MFYEIGFILYLTVGYDPIEIWLWISHLPRIYCINAIGLTNSASHTFGTRPYDIWKMIPHTITVCPDIYTKDTARVSTIIDKAASDMEDPSARRHLVNRRPRGRPPLPANLAWTKNIDSLHHKKAMEDTDKNKIVFSEELVPTPCDATNCWWVAILNGGEGWHNNHHAFRLSAKHGFQWYEIDTVWFGIWLLAYIGVIWNVKVVSAEAVDTRFASCRPDRGSRGIQSTHKRINVEKAVLFMGEGKREHVSVPTPDSTLRRPIVTQKYVTIFRR